MRIDLFCRVVDNYGDAGVTWRLARQLALEHAAAVTLWIDRPAELARIEPALDDTADDTWVEGVRVRRLHDAAPAQDLPAIVIEGFGCGLPLGYLDRMAAAPTRPVWVNLEYLSAESWIEGTHGLPSPQPRLPLTRWFYFPGFTTATGGLLRERGLLAERDASRARDTGAIPTADRPYVVSLFCYPNAALAHLLAAWEAGVEPILCVAVEDVGSASLREWLGAPVPRAGESVRRGSLTLSIAPFTSQRGFDQRLWTSDFNFVRGEDSLVRAQWAGQPHAWHLYPQAGDAHGAKLDAFLDRYLAEAPLPAATAYRDFCVAWNRGDARACPAAWGRMRAEATALQTHGQRWAARLGGQPDLATRLLDFCRDRL